MAKRKMLAFDPDRAATLEALLERRGYAAAKKKMFGHESHFLRGYMFTGANVLGVFVHLGEAKVKEALEEQTGVSPFSPMEGMVMKDYLLLGKEIAENESELTRWLDASRDYLTSLPPKSAKKKKDRP